MNGRNSKLAVFFHVIVKFRIVISVTINERFFDRISFHVLKIAMGNKKQIAMSTGLKSKMTSIPVISEILPIIKK
jgi:hypothetical protein